MPTYASPPAQIEWERTVSEHVTSDVIWQLDAYRAALFLMFCVQEDCLAVQANTDVKDQLTRASGAVSADVGEGYSRSTHSDRVRFYGYALGSARECSTWYMGLRGQLDASILNDRLALIARCRSLILGLMNSARTNALSRKKRAFEP
jgi:four helix bundle protein